MSVPLLLNCKKYFALYRETDGKSKEEEGGGEEYGDNPSTKTCRVWL